MIGVVIVAHGGLAREYLSVLEHVVGHHPGITTVSIGPEDDRAEKRSEIREALASVDDGEGVVVVTDMFGGTPSNLALSACESKTRKVLYGANMPMLVTLAKARNRPLDEAVDCAVAAGKKYINCVNGTPFVPRN